VRVQDRETDGAGPAPSGRRARREAELVEAAAARRRRLDRAAITLELAGDAAALALSAVAWVWWAAHRGPVRIGTGTLANETAAVARPGGPSWAQSVITVSGATMALIMLSACLLMAQAVNPFYAPPPQRRRLHAGTSTVFAVVALSTVAVTAGAAR
jgi:hypothetical protein